MDRRVQDVGWLATRSFAGILLIGASLLKAHQLLTVPVLASSGILGSQWMTIVLVECELLLGLLLVGAVSQQLTRVVVIILFFGFFWYAGIRTWAGDEACGCMGALPVKPWQMVLVDGVVLGALLACKPSERGSNLGSIGGVTSLSFCVLTGVALPVFVIVPENLDSAETVVSGNKLIVLEPNKWIGKRLPLLRYVTAEKSLAVGNWTLVVFKADCGQCQKLLHELPRKKLADGASGVIWVEVPPCHPDARTAVEASGRFSYGSLRADLNWFVQTPTMLRIVDGQVTGVSAVP